MIQNECNKPAYHRCGRFVLHLSALLHLWSIFITFVGFITFEVNYYICRLQRVIHNIAK